VFEFDHIGRRTNKKRPHMIMGLSMDLRVIGWAELSMTTGESTGAWTIESAKPRSACAKRYQKFRWSFVKERQRW
jgi:hypothetical protein